MKMFLIQSKFVKDWCGIANMDEVFGESTFIACNLFKSRRFIDITWDRVNLLWFPAMKIDFIFWGFTDSAPTTI